MPAELAGRRLDQAAAALLPEFSRSRLRTWIDAGELTVGGRTAKARLLLKGGEQIDHATELEAAAGQVRGHRQATHDPAHGALVRGHGNFRLYCIVQQATKNRGIIARP